MKKVKCDVCKREYEVSSSTIISMCRCGNLFEAVGVEINEEYYNGRKN
jgi:hypothetical protein